MFILGSLNTSKRQWQQQQHGLEMRYVSMIPLVHFFLYNFFFYYSNVYFRSTRHIKMVMAGTAARAQDATTGFETWTTGAAGEDS
jgi:hypothetical protein